ncbi:acyl-CoA synthetase MbcS [Oceanobacillus sp. AG]|uniref:acyl-CoA synthetase MbcS n=1 Tax=Oceanobacillus sp. AG TaxID=2681969 RepID=UPI0012EC7F00|nr:acyl--CoA ligase [Oceanobacillus sp. AG]
MMREDLIAPKQYNIAMEVEKYAKDKNKKALIWLDENNNKKEITYQALMRNVNKIGNVFLNSGLQRGDKILIIMPRLIETYEVYLAALKTGIIIIPSSEMLKANELEYRIQHGEVSGVVAFHESTSEVGKVPNFAELKKFSVGHTVDGWDFLDEAKASASDELEMADTTRETIAFLPYTSGTTGNPKGVVHTHAWGFAHLKTAPENWLGVEEDDLVWATAGPGWQKWIWSPFLSVLGTGATGFIYSGKFEPSKYLELLQDNEINVLCCTPTEYRLMAKVEHLEDYKLPHLRSAVSAGEPLNVEVIDTFRKHFGIMVRDGYGQTENTLLLGITKDMEVKPGSMGKPTPGNEVEIIDEDGNIADVNIVGDIAVHIDSPALFREYYKDMERTKASRRGDFYITGDQARKDEDGYFWFEGRRDDIIVSSGYTIGPFEVEDALVKHPFVQECAVVASPDKVRGSIVKAFIVLKQNVDKNDPGLIKELQDHVKRETAPFRYPREIEFIDELPKTSSGKIRRIELRQREMKNL